MSRARFVIYHGRAWRLKCLAERFHMKPDTLRQRLNRGMPVEQAVHTPTIPPSQSGRSGARRSCWKTE